VFPFKARALVCHLSDLNPNGAGAFQAGSLNFLSFHRDGGGKWRR
jgi:hypothetical protein